MKHLFIISFFACLQLSSAGQFQVGHTHYFFFDASRNRDIGVHIYYPAAVAGDDVPVAADDCPVIVFGHGFVMPWSDYSNIWQALVPQGYIMALPTTEGSILPSHQNFALDLAFVVQAIQEEGGNSNSLFFGTLNGQSAIAGHSMGGGCTWLAAANNSAISTIVGLAPAETNPAATAAAQNISVPALVLSGSSDSVTPPAQHHQPIYNQTASACKAIVTLDTGGHCGYADQGTICDFGEMLFSGMSRAQQQQHTQTLLLNWFDYYLKGIGQGIALFQQYVATESQLTITTTCDFNAAASSLAPSTALHIYPNPADQFIRITGAEGWVSLLETSGRTVTTKEWMAGSTLIPTVHLSPGVYFLRVTLNSKVLMHRVVIGH